MAFCLPKFAADTLKKALPTDLSKLINMTSAERRSFFSEHVGEENATRVNALFESKLLLKNQQQGLINWAKQVLGMKPDVLRDTLSKVEKLKEVLQPADMEMFLEDVASQRLGVRVTAEEAANIANLAKDVAERRAKADAEGKFPSESDRLGYGLSLALFQDYIGELKLQSKKLGLVDYVKHPTEVVSALLNTTKSILATLDNSFFGRQGLKVLYNNPRIWADTFLKSWVDIAKELVGTDATLAIKADVYSRPNALNGKYKDGQYAIGINSEEAFPTSLPGRVPILGRLFKASESAYNGGALRMRADLADKFIALAESQGRDLTIPEEAQAIGKLVNQMTGRGGIGKAEALGGSINAAFFSVKYLASLFQTFTQPFTLESSFARKQAAVSLVKIVGGIIAVNYIAEQLFPGSTESDSKGSNFGKIKIAGTTFDTTAGLGSIAVLASRLASIFAPDGKSYIKGSSGKITPLNSGKFGMPTGLDLFNDFLEGKFSPFLGAVRDRLKGKDYQGRPADYTNLVQNMFTPLPIQTFMNNLNNPKAADLMAVMIAEELGINTYTPPKK